jgi:hypothetical protein
MRNVLSQEMRERGERAVAEFLAYLRLLVAEMCCRRRCASEANAPSPNSSPIFAFSWQI